VNKLGTVSLAAIAQVLGKPGYVACDTSKLWPAALGLPPVAVHPAEEVWPDAPAKVVLRNIYFELAGYDGFDGVITEKGVLSTPEISRMCLEQVLSDNIRHIVVSSHSDFV
jgi:translation initiation factor 2B subunit (eIF-2B alpha/beta/delta family)